VSVGSVFRHENRRDCGLLERFRLIDSVAIENLWSDNALRSFNNSCYSKTSEYQVPKCIKKLNKRVNFVIDYISKHVYFHLFEPQGCERPFETWQTVFWRRTLKPKLALNFTDFEEGRKVLLLVICFLSSSPFRPYFNVVLSLLFFLFILKPPFPI
jgi:hypothetical protein